MKRQWKLMLCLCLAALTLCGCSGNREQNPVVFDTATQYLGPTETPTPTPEPYVPDASGSTDNSIFSQNPYDVPSDFTEADALREEGVIDTGISEGSSGYESYASAEDTVYPYSGSTPIPLDPVDMPSPTPRPEITFTYVAYSALGLTFEAPVGWVTDETMSDVIILSEPPEQIKDNQLCSLTISAVPVNNNYTERNLKTEVTQRLSTLSSINFVEWKPSLTATRHLLGSLGVYANYSGTLADGTKVGGRIHYSCVDNKLYGVEIVFPLEYKEDFLNVFSKVRETIKRAE